MALQRMGGTDNLRNFRSRRSCGMLSKAFPNPGNCVNRLWCAFPHVRHSHDAKQSIRRAAM
eukprot:5818429-Prorocentrum_lima.AAC.1